MSFTLRIDCQNCGKYELTTAAESELQNNDENAFYLGSWVYVQNKSGIFPRIDSETLSSFGTYPHPNVQKRAELYLGRAISVLHGRLTGRVIIDHPTLRIASWSFYREDLHALANYLVELGAIWKDPNAENYQLVTKAHLLHEQWSNTRAATSQAFVAMWFDEQMRETYDRGIAIAIREAGCEANRIDRTEYDGKIDDQIIAEIRRSAFVVADFTGHRGGVYYEAGFAHGLGRRVIFTCRSDAIQDLHFDVRQYNTIVWTNTEEILAPLQNRILALFGAGPLKPDARSASF
jgi:nucleoside 2-deoxyribosyltransferase